jgi:hypothetical protein
VIKDSAVHSNVVFFPPFVVASDYFWLFGLHVVAFGFSGFANDYGDWATQQNSSPSKNSRGSHSQ